MTINSSSTIESISRTMEDVENTKIWLNFWAKILDILIWPTFILIILIVLYINRKKITDKFPNIYQKLSNIKSLKIGNASIDFSEELAKIDKKQSQYESQNSNIVENKSDKINEDSNTDYEPDFFLRDFTNKHIYKWFTPNIEFEELARLRPDFAILDSWQSVERMLYTTPYNDSRKSPVSKILRELAKEEKLSIGHLNFILELSRLRNQVVHENNLTLSYSDAMTYRTKCVEAIQIIYSAYK